MEELEIRQNVIALHNDLRTVNMPDQYKSLFVSILMLDEVEMLVKTIQNNLWQIFLALLLVAFQVSRQKEFQKNSQNHAQYLLYVNEKAVKSILCGGFCSNCRKSSHS